MESMGTEAAQGILFALVAVVAAVTLGSSMALFHVSSLFVPVILLAIVGVFVGGVIWFQGD